MTIRKTWIWLGVAVLAVLWSVGAYNRLVTLHESIPGAWAQVENVLQRRFDLIPNLVATVKGYAKHEKDLLTEVARLRSAWGAAKTPGEKAQAGGALEGALARLLVVAENYPQLKANEGFMKLQDELAGTENRIAVERMRYNEMVQTYNTAVGRFPTNFVARFGGFKPNEIYFKMEAAAAQAPKVEF